MELKINLQGFHYLTAAQVVANEEQFEMLMVAGNTGNLYYLSPKHAKRFLMLLQQQMQAYEASYGELKTELPPAMENQTVERKLGFQLEPEESK